MTATIFLLWVDRKPCRPKSTSTFGWQHPGSQHPPTNDLAAAKPSLSFLDFLTSTKTAGCGTAGHIERRKPYPANLKGYNQICHWWSNYGWIKSRAATNHESRQLVQSSQECFIMFYQCFFWNAKIYPAMLATLWCQTDTWSTHTGHLAK